MSEDSDKYDFLKLWKTEDMSPQGIADELSVPVSRIHKWQKEFKVAEANGRLEDFINIEESVIREVVASAPVDISRQADQLTYIRQKNVRLQEGLLDTAELLNQRIKLQAMSASDADELETLVDSVCKIHTAFFKQNQAFININTGGDDSKRYGRFLSDKPQDN